MRSISIKASLLLVVAGALLFAGFEALMEATNQPDFCISCHEMESTVYQDYRRSGHHLGASGVEATCADCHVPKAFFPKVVRKVMAAGELYHWWVGTIDTQEKFERRRPLLARRVWDAMRENDSRECRSCHQWGSENQTRQGYFAQKKHEYAVQEKMTCIDCHQGLTHTLPDLEAKGAKTPQQSDYDREYAEEIMDTCAGCHGEWGQGSLDGEYPRLAGFSAGYMTRQLRRFKQRKRVNIPMYPYTTERELPDEDVAVIARYLAEIELPSQLCTLNPESEFNALDRLMESKRVLNIPLHEGDQKAGAELYRRECITCHGRDGEGRVVHHTPPMAGQHSGYLKRQIGRFGRGERLHDDDPEDARFFAGLDQSKINNLLAYISLLDDDRGPKKECKPQK